jgi:orotidine-5'-phosphate decarboxylase
MPNTHLIVALDVNTIDEADALVDSIGDSVSWFKVGKQLFTRCGPEIVSRLKAKGKNVFLDLKFHDIPNTVAQAVTSAIELGADMVNVHSSGGSQMMSAAVDAVSQHDKDALLIAVSILTSMTDETLEEIGMAGPVKDQVLRLATLAHASGVHGMVCSAHEIESIKDACGSDFKVVVPGIRPAGSASNDQKRIMTPEEAARIGADYIVVGRPITQADSPSQAAADIQASLLV